LTLDPSKSQGKNLCAHWGLESGLSALKWVLSIAVKGREAFLENTLGVLQTEPLAESAARLILPANQTALGASIGRPSLPLKGVKGTCPQAIPQFWLLLASAFDCQQVNFRCKFFVKF
jgi:hypothetical protein